MGVFAGVTAAQWLMIGTTAAATGASIHAQRQATGAQEVELELAQREEAAAARDREVQRKRRLTAIMGEQAASAAAGGVAMSGSVANITITDAKRAAEESFIDQNMTSSRIRQLGRRRSTVSRLGTLRNATTILGAGARMAERGDFDGVFGGGQVQHQEQDRVGGATMGEFKSKIAEAQGMQRHQAVVKQVRARQAAGPPAGKAPTGGNRRKATTIFGAGRR